MKTTLVIAVITAAWSVDCVAQTLDHSNSMNQDSSFEIGFDHGTKAASEIYQPERWLLAGFGGGFILGPIGTGALMGLSQAGSELPPEWEFQKYAAEDDGFRQGFTKGYNHRAKSKALGSSLTGGLFGTAAIGFIMYMIFSQPMGSVFV